MIATLLADTLWINLATEMAAQISTTHSILGCLLRQLLSHFNQTLQ